MADAKTYLEGIEISDEVKTKIAEKLNPILAKFEADVSDAAGKLDDAIKSRTKAKDELKDLREKFANGDFDGKKDMDALIKLKESEVASLNDKTTKLENELALTKTELETIQTETKTELKTRFSDEEWEKIKSWSVSDIRIAAGLKPEVKVAGDQSKRLITYGDRKDEKSSEEKIASIYKKVS